MIYLQLFVSFLKVGCFAFGGAYSAIPLVSDVVTQYGWMGSEELSYMIAISESTPGPLMINMATYVGSIQAGIPGAIISTIAVVIPSFTIILIITLFLKNALKNKYVQYVFKGLIPCVIGIILSVGLYMILEYCLIDYGIDYYSILILLILIIIYILYNKFKHKKMSPIMLIVVSGILGILVYGI